MPGSIGEISTGENNDDRIILHCDLNSFYASVESLYKPELKNKPMAVGGSVKKRHGIILAKNQIAKTCGVKTAEPIWKAMQKCPNLVIVPPDMSKYIKYSALVVQIYKRYTDIIEPFGIDECWLDVTGSTMLLGDGPSIADSIRKTIREELGLTVSAGVSWNKIFAKLGSDMKKPDATTVITRENYKKLVWPLPVEDLLFIGKSTGSKLRRVGITTIGRLAVVDEKYLITTFGKWGHTLHSYANGKDTSEVDREWESIQAKGIGNSTTTPNDITTYEEAKAVLTGLSENVATRIRNANLIGHTIVLSIRNCDLETKERQRMISVPTCLAKDILQTAMDLLKVNWDPKKNKPLRSLGVRVSSLIDSDCPVQMSFFDLPKEKQRDENIERTIDSLRERFGDDSVLRALMLKDK